MPPPSPVDPLDVIERAYDLEAPDDKWLRELLDRVRPELGADRGIVAYQYDASARPLQIGVMVGECEPTQQDLIDVVSSADDQYVEDSYLLTPFGTASEQPGFDRQVTFERRLGKYGVRDAIALNCCDPTGLGVWIGGLLSERRTLEEAERGSWPKVAQHVASAMRLRARLRASSTPPPLAAVFTPDGATQHLESAVEEARLELASAVRSLDRARGSLRKSSPDSAVNTWKVLVNARYTLVDQFESDGKRFVVAHANESPAMGPEQLSVREREVLSLALLGHSAKLIAYSLGLAHSTVRVHLTNASRKLGARTRRELVDRYRAWLLGQTR